MSGRFASLVVCDDIYIALNGKWNIVGVYTGDLVIASPGTLVQQLVFLFLIETDINDPFHSITLEVTLPEGTPARLELADSAIAPVSAPEPNRTKFILRTPLLIPQAILRPGRISAKVLHEKGEIAAVAPWITLVRTQ